MIRIRFTQRAYHCLKSLGRILKPFLLLHSFHSSTSECFLCSRPRARHSGRRRKGSRQTLFLSFAWSNPAFQMICQQNSYVAVIVWRRVGCLLSYIGYKKKRRLLARDKLIYKMQNAFTIKKCDFRAQFDLYS